jgi:hypothetical protein
VKEPVEALRDAVKEQAAGEDEPPFLLDVNEN